MFSTGNPDGKIATASRPGAGTTEIESADDFALTQQTTLTSATFTGLIVPAPGALPSIGNVVVEIYRVFPNLSDVGRTSGPPTFSTPNVPTRVNSPSDVELDGRDSSVAGELTFTINDLGGFSALNSVQPGGIPKPFVLPTGGDGPVSGEKIVFQVTFTKPFDLPPDHYFFVPQVEVTDGTFLWLSAPKPIVAPGTPFPAGFNDLQSWTRDQFLDPDWLRVGTDIVGGSPAPTFNATFSLVGVAPEPGSLVLAAAGLLGLWLLRRKNT
jgi:hypothetical protein